MKNIFLGLLIIVGGVCACKAWDVKVINNSNDYWRVLACFDPLCAFHSDELHVPPKTTKDIPLPAGAGSCLHHIYYKNDGAQEVR